jgi:hypothetical protein
MSRMSLSPRASAVAAGGLVAAVAAAARADGPQPIPAALALVPRVVLVDEGPFRGARPHVRDVPDPARAAAKRRREVPRPYHPAPGIVVDVTKADGALDAAALQRAARNLGYWPIRRCYEEGLRRSQQLSGNVLVAMTVGANGAVDRATVPSATVEDESVVLCVAREVQHLSFAASSSETSALLSVSLFRGDEPVPLPYGVPHSGELREALRGYWPQVESCYRRGLAKHPDVGGPMDLHFRVAGNGEILEVTEHEGSARFADDEVTRCVVRAYTGATLRIAGGGAARESSFEYSLHFESAQGAVGLEPLSPRALQSVSPALQ